jgi:hypothetical protein
MATVNEHIYAIQNILEHGPKSDDSNISNRLVLHYMNIARVLLLKRKADKKQRFDPSDFQSFCMPLCEDTWIDCECLPDDLGCKILKGKFKIPQAMTSRTGLYLTVRFFSGRELDITTLSAMQHRKNSIVKKNRPAWFIDNNYLYIIGIPNNLLKAVYVTGVFIDPTSLEEISLCGPGQNEPCFDTLEDEYPISGELVEPMYKLVIQHLAQAFRFPEDNINDALDNDQPRL